MKPYDATRLDEKNDLSSDHKQIGDCSILTDGYRVSLSEQKVGHAPTQHITLPRATFNKLVDWYMKEQTPPASSSGRTRIART